MNGARPTAVARRSCYGEGDGYPLKQGRVLASGDIDAVCTSRVLSEAFGRPCHVTHDGGRLVLRAHSGA